jgi:RNA polymerase sigma-70 factor (ECF subfamily)
MSRTDLSRRFEQYLRDHRGIAFKVAGFYTHSAADRDDLLQDIHIQAWRAFARFDERRASFATWLYRVALNVAISRLRREDRRRDRHEPLQAFHLETIEAEAAPPVDERLKALAGFIIDLAPLDRALILLYLEERSHAEMALILGIGQSNVATKISRIKQGLRKRMTANAHEEARV